MPRTMFVCVSKTFPATIANLEGDTAYFMHAALLFYPVYFQIFADLPPEISPWGKNNMAASDISSSKSMGYSQLFHTVLRSAGLRIWAKYLWFTPCKLIHFFFNFFFILHVFYLTLMWGILLNNFAKGTDFRRYYRSLKIVYVCDIMQVITLFLWG